MTDRIAPAAGYRRIATEEAFIPPELHKMYRDLVASGVLDEVRAQDSLPISDADKKKFYQTIADNVFRL